MLQREHSAILSTFVKLPVVIKTFVLSIFLWPFYTGFTVFQIPLVLRSEFSTITGGNCPFRRNVSVSLHRRGDSSGKLYLFLCLLTLICFSVVLLG